MKKASVSSSAANVLTALQTELVAGILPATDNPPLFVFLPLSLICCCVACVMDPMTQDIYCPLQKFNC